MNTQDFVADARKIAAQHLRTYGSNAECDPDGHLRIELFREELALRIQDLPDLSGTNATPVIYLDLAVVGRDMDDAGKNIVACVEAENLQENGIVEAVEYLMIVASDVYEPDDGLDACTFSKPFGTDSSPVSYSEFSENSKVWFRASSGHWFCYIAIFSRNITIFAVTRLKMQLLTLKRTVMPVTNLTTLMCLLNLNRNSKKN